MSTNDKDFKLKHHQLTVKGTADDSGLILTNAAPEGEGLTPQERAKKKADKEANTRRLLQDSAEYWKGQIEKIDKQLECGKKLRELYKKGKLDFDNPEHIALMNEYGITQEQIEANGEGAFDDRDTELYNDRINAVDMAKKTVELDQRQKETPDDEALSAEIDDFLAADFGLDDFEDETIASTPSTSSVSKEVAPEGGIEFKNITSEFNNVGTGIAQNNTPTPPTEPNQNITFGIT